MAYGKSKHNFKRFSESAATGVKGQREALNLGENVTGFTRGGKLVSQRDRISTFALPLPLCVPLFMVLVLSLSETMRFIRNAGAHKHIHTHIHIYSQDHKGYSCVFQL